MRSNIIYLDSVAGIAGDMFCSAFVHAGLVTADELNQIIQNELGLLDVTLDFSKVNKAGIDCFHLKVKFEENGRWKKAFPGAESGTHTHAHGHTKDHGHDHDHDHDHDYDHDHDHDHTHVHKHGHDHTYDHTHPSRVHAPSTNSWHTHYSALQSFLEHSKLGAECKALSLKILKTLGLAEARVHGLELQDVVFHEVGTVDSLVDVVCAAFCITKIHPVEIYASPVKLGHGYQKMEHGLHAIPAPATLILSEGLTTAPLPTDEKFECSTPTGVSILKALEPKFLSQIPEGKIVTHGYGAGTKELKNFPNVFRIMVLSSVKSFTTDLSEKFETDEVIEVVSNFDDMNPEHLAWLSAKLLAPEADEGFECLDVWQIPFTGKKGRMGAELHVLCTENKKDLVMALILECSTTFGVRHQKWNRKILKREFELRKIEGSTFRFKVGYDGAGRKLKEKPEFEDVKKSLDLRAQNVWLRQAQKVKS